MSDAKIITNYAASLFANAVRLKLEKKTLDQVQCFNDMMKADTDLYKAMVSGIVTSHQKMEVATLIGKKLKFESIVNQFLQILAQNARLNLLSEIIELYLKLLADSKNIKLADISAADKLDTKEIKIIKEFLEEKLGKTVDFKIRQKPELIGGVTIKYDSYLIDCSVAGALSKIEKVTKMAKIN